MISFHISFETQIDFGKSFVVELSGERGKGRLEENF
jgi:hypothetical protein